MEGKETNWLNDQLLILILKISMSVWTHCLTNHIKINHQIEVHKVVQIGLKVLTLVPGRDLDSVCGLLYGKELNLSSSNPSPHTPNYN